MLTTWTTGRLAHKCYSACDHLQYGIKEELLYDIAQLVSTCRRENSLIERKRTAMTSKVSMRTRMTPKRVKYCCLLGAGSVSRRTSLLPRWYSLSSCSRNEYFGIIAMRILIEEERDGLIEGRADSIRWVSTVVEKNKFCRKFRRNAQFYELQGLQSIPFTLLWAFRLRRCL